MNSEFCGLSGVRGLYGSEFVYCIALSTTISEGGLVDETGYNSNNFSTAVKQKSSPVTQAFKGRKMFCA